MLRRDLVIVVPRILQCRALPDPIALFHQYLPRLGVVKALLPKKMGVTKPSIIIVYFSLFLRVL